MRTLVVTVMLFSIPIFLVESNIIAYPLFRAIIHYYSFRDKVMRKSTSLSVTLVIVSIIIATVITFSVGGFAIYELEVANKHSNDNYKIAMYDGYRTEIKSQVQAALAILQNLHDQEMQGLITIEEAQYQGKEILRSMRYRNDHSGYFWIDDKGKCRPYQMS